MLRLEGPTAGGDQDSLGGEAVAVDLHRVPVEQPRPALDDAHPGVLEQSPIDAVEAFDFPILVGDQRRPIEGRGRHRPAKTGGIFGRCRKGRGVDHQFLRHTSQVDAGAAEIRGLGHRHPRTVAGRHAARAHTARTCTDDEEVEVVVCHEGHPIPSLRGA